MCTDDGLADDAQTNIASKDTYPVHGLKTMASAPRQDSVIPAEADDKMEGDLSDESEIQVRTKVSARTT